MNNPPTSNTAQSQESDSAQPRGDGIAERLQRLSETRVRLDDLIQRLVEQATERVGDGDSSAASRVGPTVLAKARAENSTYVLLRVPVSDSPQLTRREQEIAILASEGLQNKAIAERLNISRATVAAHLRRIFTKLQVKTRTELACHTILMG